MNEFTAGLFFSAVPALFIGMFVGLFSPAMGLIVGACVFGFGIDLCFRGSGREDRR